jgi:transposase
VRKIDAALDLSWLCSELAPHYSSIGRPSIDPELMIRMLVVGNVIAIRSERLICREVQVNLAYRWFCRLGIEDAIPDHSAFSRARNERFRERDVFRRVFERVVKACIAAGLVGGEGFAVDASLIAADANKQRSIAGQDWRRDRDPRTASRAVKEYLATLDTAWGAASGVVPKFVSPSHPAAQWTGAIAMGPFLWVVISGLGAIHRERLLDGPARFSGQSAPALLSARPNVALTRRARRGARLGTGGHYAVCHDRADPSQGQGCRNQDRRQDDHRPTGRIATASIVRRATVK